MKKLPLAITALLLSTTAHAAEMMPVRSITVTGNAERTIVPDEAHLEVNLNSLNAKMAEAKADHDKKLRQLLDITGKAGIDKGKVKTTSSSTQPQYDYANGQRQFRGYRVQTQLDITVADTSKVADLMEKISAAGFEKGASTEWGNLLDLNYQISDPKKITDELNLDAIKNARSKAEKMADAAGASLGDVYQITEGSAPQFDFPRPMPMMMAKSALAEAAPVAPPTGEQKINTTVTVTFELK